MKKFVEKVGFGMILMFIVTIIGFLACCGVVLCGMIGYLYGGYDVIAVGAIFLGFPLMLLFLYFMDKVKSEIKQILREE